MKPRCAKPGLSMICLLVSVVYAQSNDTTLPDEIPGDRSFYLNKPVDHPEALSGIWEASDSQGGAVGLHLQLMTMVSGDADRPVWIPQRWQHLSFGVFQRKGPEIAFGEENSFSDSDRGGAGRIEDGRIRLHFVSDWKVIPSVDLDLLRQPGGCWHGRFHRGGFDLTVTLCRPTPDSTVVRSLLTGTWTNDREGCVHIFESGPGTFTGWSDAREVPGQIVFGSNLTGPHDLFQTYGDIAKVKFARSGEVSLEFGAYNPVCCSHLFNGKLSSDGSAIQGDYAPGPIQAPLAAVWTKVRRESCVDPAKIHRAQPTACPPGKN